MKTKNILWILFWSVFKISSCTFGGGFVIVPLLKRKFSDEMKLIDDSEMLDLVAIAQSSPGAIAVNASLIVGYKVSGVCGALVCLLGSVLPPIIIISVISLFYKTFRDNVYVGLLMSGMLCGVAAVIIDVVINMIKSVAKEKRILPLVVMFSAFVALRFFAVNIIVIILVCALVGAIDVIVRAKKKEAKKDDIS